MAGVMAKPTKAVIYARVSGAKQVREGDGLASQENRCGEYATYKDYDVVEVFKDDMSGKFERRPAMDRMLAFLRLHPKGSVVVIIDDISRFARDVQAHISLRQTLSDAGGILESPPSNLVRIATPALSNTCWPRSHSTNARRTLSKPPTA